MASYLDCKRQMHKKIIVLIGILFCIVTSHAQKNIYDNVEVDTAATQEEEVIVSPPEEETSTYNNEELKKEKKYLPGWGDEVDGDTLIKFRTVYINPDSVASWKSNSKYAWVKIIDSSLRASQKKDNNKAKESIKNYDDSPSALDNFFNSSFLRIFLWILAICFVAFIIYHLFLSKGVFGKASKRAAIAEEEEEIQDHLDNDFDRLYNKALAAGDTRMAMRYLFLKVLQKLNEKELIQFAVDKTNSMYAREIPLAKRNNFAQIALYYEYIWYGNTSVSIQHFDGIKNKVNEFINSI
jgi:hypothetical protein